MKRRDLLKISALAGLAATATHASADTCAGDGTPAQFVPKKPADAKPLENELEKYPKCPYCGMDRKEHHRTRMLVQYSDDLTDGTCSIHCLALSLGVNIDREPKNIWGPDYGSATEPRPLVPVDNLTYLIGADLKHAMTKKSKHSFASADVASTEENTVLNGQVPAASDVDGTVVAPAAEGRGADAVDAGFQRTQAAPGHAGAHHHEHRRHDGEDAEQSTWHQDRLLVSACRGR